MKTTKILLPLILLFIIFNTFFLFGKNFLLKFQLDYGVLILANFLFFLISIIAFQLQKRALKNPNPNVFIRSVMGGMMIKMAITIIAVITYVLIYKNSFSKYSVFASMFLYLIYLAVEVKVSTNLNKQNNV